MQNITSPKGIQNMSTATEAGSNPSLSTLYDTFFETFHELNSYQTTTVALLIIVGIITVALITGALWVFFQQRKHRELLKSVDEESSELSSKNTSYSDVSEIEHEAVYNAYGVVSFALVMFGLVLLFDSTLGVFSKSSPRYDLAPIAEQVQDTVVEHITEDYTVASVKSIPEPHEDEGIYAQRDYQFNMIDWAENFYESGGELLTVEVQLEDNASEVYTYRLWYDTMTDRARLLDAPELSTSENNAPTVETLERGNEDA